MTPKKILLISTAAVIPVAVIGSISYYKYVQNNVSIEADGFFINVPRDNAVDIDFNFKVTNKTDISFLVKKANCNIYLNNQFLGISYLKNSVDIPVQSQKTIKITGTFTADQIGNYLITAITSIFSGQKNMNFSVTGSCSIALNYALMRPFPVSIAIDNKFSV